MTSFSFYNLIKKAILFRLILHVALLPSCSYSETGGDPGPDDPIPAPMIDPNNVCQDPDTNGDKISVRLEFQTIGSVLAGLNGGTLTGRLDISTQVFPGNQGYQSTSIDITLQLLTNGNVQSITATPLQIDNNPGELPNYYEARMLYANAQESVTVTAPNLGGLSVIANLDPQINPGATATIEVQGVFTLDQIPGEIEERQSFIDSEACRGVDLGISIIPGELEEIEFVPPLSFDSTLQDIENGGDLTLVGPLISQASVIPVNDDGTEGAPIPIGSLPIALTPGTPDLIFLSNGYSADNQANFTNKAVAYAREIMSRPPFNPDLSNSYPFTEAKAYILKILHFSGKNKFSW